ncbi:MAG: hypothetical protein IPM42_05440 [Saprospiraceae bacterium]|nr:hypothetical protein [Saprospiraceae bacterium]
MHDRNDIVLNLRPEIFSVETGKIVSESESLVHQTIRPILKFQNKVMLHYTIAYCRNRKISLNIQSQDALKSKISGMLQKDITFRNTLTGFIIGLMSDEELQTYMENEPEMKRRIVEMLSVRLCEQLPQLI